MKINKLIRKEVSVNRTSECVEFKNLNEDYSMNKEQIFEIIDKRVRDAICTHVSTSKKVKNSIYRKFINGEITLFKFIRSTFNTTSIIKICDRKYYKNWTGDNKDKIDFDFWSNEINIFKLYDDICKVFDESSEKKIEPYKKFYVPEIINAIELACGKNFLKYVGDIFANRNKFIDDIVKGENSYVNVTMNSLLGNKIKTDNSNLPEDVLNLAFSEVKDQDFISLINNALERNKISEISNIENIKKSCAKRINKNDPDDKAVRMIISGVDDFFYSNTMSISENKNRIKSLRKKLMKMIGDDFRYIINSSKVTKNAKWLCETLVDICNKKIELIKVYNLNFVLMETYYKPENDVYTDENKIISHSIFKLYKNLSVIVGSNIVNYNKMNLKNVKNRTIKDNENGFKDFSDIFKEFNMDEYLNDGQFWLSDWKKEFTESYITSSIFLRNMIIHQRKFGDSTNKEFDFLNYKISEKVNSNSSNLNLLKVIEEKYNEKKIDILTSYKIKFNDKNCFDLYDSDKLMISNSFKNMFNKVLNASGWKSKLATLIVNVNLDRQKSEDTSNSANAKYYLLKQVFNNNFQDWLSDTSNTFELDYFKNWYKVISKNNHENLSFPVTKDCSYYDAQLIFDDYLSKWDEKSTTIEKEKSLAKRKSLVSYFTIYCFEKFVEENKILDDIDNLKCHLVHKNVNSFDNLIGAFLASSLNLSNYEISRLINILDNFVNRTYKNKSVKVEYETNYLKNWYFSDANIKEIIYYLRLLIVINTSDYDMQSNDNRLTNILESYENENFNNNSSNHNYKMLQYYSNSIMNSKILSNLNNSWESLELGKINVFELNEVVPENENKVDQLNRSKRNNFENGQAIIDAINLFNEINYWEIRWVMYREFYTYQSLKNVRKEVNVLSSISLKKGITDEIKNKIIDVNESLSNVNLKKFDSVKELIFKDTNEFKNAFKYCKEVSKEFNKIVPKISRQITGNLSQILHFQEHKYDKYEFNLCEIVNKIREIHSSSRNNKNMITPSLMKLFDKHKLIIDFEFNDHNVEKFSLESKVIKLDNKVNVELVSEEELKIYKNILNMNEM